MTPTSHPPVLRSAALATGVLLFAGALTTVTTSPATAHTDPPAADSSASSGAGSLQPGLRLSLQRAAPRARWAPNGAVQDIAFTRDRVYLAGAFTKMINRATGDRVKRLRVAALNRRTGELVRGFRAAPTGGRVNDVAVLGHRLVLGGSFTAVSGHRRLHLAAVKLGSGRLIRSFRMQVNGPVLALLGIDRDLYVGGAFTSVAGDRRSRLFKATAGGDLVPGWPSKPAQGTTAGVYALSSRAGGSRIYVGGNFHRLGGSPRDYLGRISARSGRVSNWKPAPLCAGHCPVTALTVDRRAVYAGIGGEDGAVAYRQRNAATRWTRQSDGAVTAVARAGSRLVLGGHFSRIGGRRHAMYAELSAGTGRVLPRRPHAAGPLLPGILALNTRGTSIRVGGGFTDLAGQPRYAILSR